MNVLKWYKIELFQQTWQTSTVYFFDHFKLLEVPPDFVEVVPNDATINLLELFGDFAIEAEDFLGQKVKFHNFSHSFKHATVFKLNHEKEYAEFLKINHVDSVDIYPDKISILATINQETQNALLIKNSGRMRNRIISMTRGLKKLHGGSN